jgi:hypothetical protein
VSISFQINHYLCMIERIFADYFPLILTLSENKPTETVISCDAVITHRRKNSLEFTKVSMHSTKLTVKLVFMSCSSKLKKLLLPPSVYEKILQLSADFYRTFQFLQPVPLFRRLSLSDSVCFHFQRPAFNGISLGSNAPLLL